MSRSAQRKQMNYYAHAEIVFACIELRAKVRLLVLFFLRQIPR